jgi:hypothetical protein
MATVAIKRSMITDIFSCKWNANEMVPWTIWADLGGLPPILWELHVGFKFIIYFYFVQCIASSPNLSISTL